jgi:hypothetical protein
MQETKQGTGLKTAGLDFPEAELQWLTAKTDAKPEAEANSRDENELERTILNWSCRHRVRWIMPRFAIRYL